MTYDRLVAQMDSAVRLPGVTNAWTMPIKARIDMLATGIRTPVGIKVFGPDLAELERVGREIERAVQTVPGTRSAFAERAVSRLLPRHRHRPGGGRARYGLNVGDVQAVIATAIGGMTITQTVEGRERYGVRVRYPQELRDTPERLASVLVPVAHESAAASGRPPARGWGAAPGRQAGGGVTQVPLGQLATIKAGGRARWWCAPRPRSRRRGCTWTSSGATSAATWRKRRPRSRRRSCCPPGYSVVWSGQYEYMQRAKETMKLVIPATLAIIFLLLYFNFKSVGETLIVMLSLPFALVGGIWFIWALGYNWSVAVAIGFIALAGVAAETGVVMLIYLDHAWKARAREGHRRRCATSTTR